MCKILVRQRILNPTNLTYKEKFDIISKNVSVKLSSFYKLLDILQKVIMYIFITKIVKTPLPDLLF